jgi:hypothetical protein
LIRKPVKSWKTHARPAKRASAAIVVPVVKAAAVDAAKAVATVDPVVMAVDGAKAAATVAHAKSVQKAKTRAGAIPTMCQLS